jgi:hypothetical protein
MTTQVHREPADQHGHGTEAATRDEKQSTVLNGMMVMDVEEDAEPGHGDEHRDDSEDKPVAQFVRQKGDEHGDAKRRGPWRDGVELCFDG